ncbi:MAG: BrnT family toxin [Acidobacteria bacterium]|nr:MAG: BrnT family toxin [Acidobacteriota bacterium]REK08818.1 MAG: BrnT family toxin [Acidobacteriota bacterium]
MDYEWDPDKARSNRRRHGVSFADATAVFEDEMAISMPDARFEAEERFLVVGSDYFGRVLVIAFTYREERIRIISARRATSRERRQYEDF